MKERVTGYGLAVMVLATLVLVAAGVARQGWGAGAGLSPSGLLPVVEVRAEGPRGVLPEVRVEAGGPEFRLPVVEVRAPSATGPVRLVGADSLRTGANREG